MGCKQASLVGLRSSSKMPSVGLCRLRGHSPRHSLWYHTQPGRHSRQHGRSDQACSISTTSALPCPAPWDFLECIGPGHLLLTPDQRPSLALVLPGPPALCTRDTYGSCLQCHQGRDKISAVRLNLGLIIMPTGSALLPMEQWVRAGGNQGGRSKRQSHHQLSLLSLKEEEK